MNLFYLLLSITSVSFAEVAVDWSMTGVDVLNPNTTPNTKITARAFPNVRRNLGQEACAADTRTIADPRTRNRRYTYQTKLLSAVCENDIDYTAKCQTVIPTNNNAVITHQEKCVDDEVCQQVSYRNFLGQTSSEVSCVEKDAQRHQFEWSTDSSSTDGNHCGPGLTVINEEDDLTISVQFYGGNPSSHAPRKWVSEAWLQSNKRTERIEDIRGVNGLYWKGAGHTGETIQACFIRNTVNDATNALLNWVDG
ncbi:hypothetical protein COCCADRAFT_31123 [Bipolaris zeicola 26-R-13]|uniref:Ig-like domain-containing protein n=1 Tax=Cochliobolus carbonum (strain 26-R-13) TaxID=930089 RepID=W6XJQ9_COCC2|nr:uncharacterized protein COCCADRAFT_31123 [Bipolaris zeicola 26-R-13]EUC27397.1 hypothetical protein COCCADRAFT_31123 [Bipolaris zeicola 26-R-13]